MKDITKQAFNRVNIVGKLLDLVVREGKLSDGRAYKSANMTVRVTQKYGGREETSEIPISMFASRYTLAGKPNPGYEQIEVLEGLNTAQNVGIDAASIVRINSGTLRESNFVARSGQLVNTWQLNTSFAGPVKSMPECATFDVDVFIMDMKPEEDREGDSTGRLIIKGGIVQYNGNLDVVEFIVENPEAVDYIERHYNNNDTVNIKGRVRVTVIEERASGGGSWGEDIPETTTRTVRELIVTKGDDEPREEEFAYDPVEIKKAFNVRKAKIEQLQVNAQNGGQKVAEKSSTSTSKYNWE